MKLNTQFKSTENTHKLILTTKETSLKKQLKVLVSKMNDDRFIVKASAIFYDGITGNKSLVNFEQNKITFGQNKTEQFMTIRYDSPYSINRFVQRIKDSDPKGVFIGVEISIVDKEGKTDEYDTYSVFTGEDLIACSNGTIKLYYDATFIRMTRGSDMDTKDLTA